MDSLINDIQEKVAKYVTCSEAIHNAVVLTRNQTLAQVEKIIDEHFNNSSPHLCCGKWVEEEIKNLKEVKHD